MVIEPKVKEMFIELFYQEGKTAFVELCVKFVIIFKETLEDI